MSDQPQGERGHLRTLMTLASYLWPQGEPGLRLRVVASLALLVAARGVNVLVPIAFGRAVDALTPHGDGLPAFGRYGWHWWIARAENGDAVRCMLGHGGQLVFVVPERKLVAVFTANPKVSRWKHPIRLFERYVLPLGCNPNHFELQ